MSNIGSDYITATATCATQLVKKASRHDVSAAIRAALPAVFRSGQVVELRVLRVDGKKRTDSGYFNDFNKLAQAAAGYEGRAQAIYITLNPVNPALIARANNRVKEYADTTTSDHDILKRQWFCVDFDPVRPADISSSDEEHQAALDRAALVGEWFYEQGWPAPLYADSGNGAHLLYAIDLPNDDASADLLKAALAALAARFDDAYVEVDQSVFNASRIWKLYGTLARKGDDMPERPHRRAGILKGPPGEQGIVSREQLEALAAQAPKVEPKRPTAAGNSHNPQNGHSSPNGTLDHTTLDTIKQGFDMVAYAQKHFPGSTREDSGGEVRILGNGGLLINPDKGVWNHFQNGQGGDAVDLVGYVMFGTSWSRTDKQMFRRALEAAAQETNVILPERTQPTPANGQAHTDNHNAASAAPSILQKSLITKIEKMVRESSTQLFHGRYVDNLSAPEWLMNLVLPQKSIGLFWGQSGIGKSFIMLHLAMLIAVHSPVIYVANEGWNGYGTRRRAWMRHNKVDPDHFYFRKELNLFNAEALESAENLILQLEYLKVKPAMIVIDSLANAITGADDNSAQDVGIITARLRRLSEATGATVIVVHHPTKDGKSFRGSGSFLNNFDFVISAEQEDDQVIVRCDKMKDFDPFPEQRIAFIPVDTGLVDKQGQPIFSRVVVPADKVVQTKDDPLSPLQRRIAQALADNEDGLTTSELVERLRVASSSLHAALAKLRKFSFITQERKGTEYTLTPEGLKALNNNEVSPTNPTGINMTRLLFPLMNGDATPTPTPSPMNTTHKNGSMTGNSTSPLEFVATPKTKVTSPFGEPLHPSTADKTNSTNGTPSQSGISTSPMGKSLTPTVKAASPTGSLLFQGIASPSNSNEETQSASTISTISNSSPMPSPMISTQDDQSLTPHLHSLPPSIKGERVGDRVEMEGKEIETPHTMPYDEIVERSTILAPDRQAAFLAVIQDSPIQTSQSPVTGEEINAVLTSVSQDEAAWIENTLSEMGISIYYAWLAQRYKSSSDQ